MKMPFGIIYSKVMALVGWVKISSVFQFEVIFQANSTFFIEIWVLSSRDVTRTTQQEEAHRTFASERVAKPSRSSFPDKGLR